jgi:hypothetical protein
VAQREEQAAFEKREAELESSVGAQLREVRAREVAQFVRESGRFGGGVELLKAAQEAGVLALSQAEMQEAGVSDAVRARLASARSKLVAVDPEKWGAGDLVVGDAHLVYPSDAERAEAIENARIA